MFVEMHVAYLLQKVHTLDPRTFPGNDLMQVAFDNNSRLAGVFLAQGSWFVAARYLSRHYLAGLRAIHAFDRRR